jgi:exosortase A-associated hydrolase 2
VTASSHVTSARFLGVPGSRLLTLHYQPSTRLKAHIIYIPPFGEEMNRCRALVAEQSRQFADLGYSCTTVDLFGTGDSEGELQDTSFDIWHENIDLVIETLLQVEDAPVILWGLRLGGLLALDFAIRSTRPIQDIILWQPVNSGKRFVKQLLRQRVAALVGKDLPPETTGQIRALLEAGEKIEVSGYTVGDSLMSDIENCDLLGMETLCTGKIHWLENTSDLEQPVGTASLKIIDQLQDQHNNVEVHRFTDPPLWQLHKRDSAPELLEITAKLLS